MLQEFIKAGCKNVLDINNLIDKDNHYKFLFPNHITLLCKNQVGYKNLYKIISDALTVHCLNNGILLKSVLDKYREGLLVGSACSNGRVFECAMYYSDEELDKAIEYCDYIEVQPPLAYKHLFSELPNGIKDIEEIIIKIITRAKALNKIVVATSNCHYLRPELKKYRDNFDCNTTNWWWTFSTF
ncbi:MAG: PHP domain-containing protein [Clostridium sp.]|nr:MAG: PHP domain-containing protein [Clostridium sp.]